MMDGWMRFRLLVCGLGILLPALPTVRGPVRMSETETAGWSTAVQRCRRPVTGASHARSFKLSSRFTETQRKQMKLILMNFMLPNIPKT